MLVKETIKMDNHAIHRRPDILITAGADPGLAKFGLAILKNEDQKISLVETLLLETEKSDKKVMRDLRVSADDQRRLKEFWDILIERLVGHKVKAAGIESYAPFPGSMGGNSWKVAL